MIARQNGKTRARMDLLKRRYEDLIKDSARRDDHVLVYLTYRVAQGRELGKEMKASLDPQSPYQPDVIFTTLRGLKKAIRDKKIFDIIIDPVIFE